MKLSVSLSERDVALVDEYARSAGLPSRSAVVQQAIRSLSLTRLEENYAEAWEDWQSSGDEDRWDNAAADGLA